MTDPWRKSCGHPFKDTFKVLSVLAPTAPHPHRVFARLPRLRIGPGGDRLPEREPVWLAGQQLVSGILFLFPVQAPWILRLQGLVLVAWGREIVDKLCTLCRDNRKSGH